MVVCSYHPWPYRPMTTYPMVVLSHHCQSYGRTALSNIHSAMATNDLTLSESATLMLNSGGPKLVPMETLGFL